MDDFVNETVDIVCSYNVDKREIFEYLYMGKNISQCSYEMQCAIFDLDPIGYTRDCHILNKFKF